MYESYSVTNLGYKCIECIHLDSIDFHLDILSLLLDQNSYLFDDNLENKISERFFLKSYLGRPDSIRPFSELVSCSFSILLKGSHMIWAISFQPMG